MRSSVAIVAVGFGDDAVVGRIACKPVHHLRHSTHDPGHHIGKIGLI
jgi:hypothetical protein